MSGGDLTGHQKFIWWPGNICAYLQVESTSARIHFLRVFDVHKDTLSFFCITESENEKFSMLSPAGLVI